MKPKCRILIVDDDKRMTRTLADILNMAGHEAAEASSGQQALELIRAQSFDCVLTDVRMPEMDGVEFHRQLLQFQPGLPVVLMTAYASDEIIRKGLEEGVVGVLDKPLDISQLLSFFSSLIKNQTIAIVDDDPSFCKTLCDILGQRGFKVAQVTDPHADLELIAAESQVILLDMKLNSVNGLDLLKNIRGRYPSLPVVLITGYRQEMAKPIEAAMRIQAYTCLYKPLVIPDLLKTISQIQVDRLRSMLPGRQEGRLITGSERQ